MDAWSWLFAATAVVSVALTDAAAGSRVLHVDSYHEGNIWNDRIRAALVGALEAEGIEVRVMHLDAKRKPEVASVEAAVGDVLDAIEAFDPDVVTASDDPAAEFLIAPHLAGGSVPVVFSGLNWDASIYGLPKPNVTGMVEVSPIPQIVRLLKAYARGGRIGVITEDTATKRKEIEFHEKLFGIRYDGVYLASDFREWSDLFRRAQGEVDMLIVLGVGAITDWDEEAARELAETGSAIPSGTDFEWLMGVSLLGVAKRAEEQGEWTAEAVLKILDGVAPSRIPLAHNKEGTLYFNARIAARLGIKGVPPLAQSVR